MPSATGTGAETRGVMRCRICCGWGGGGIALGGAAVQAESGRAGRPCAPALPGEHTLGDDHLLFLLAWLAVAAYSLPPFAFQVPGLNWSPPW